MKKEVFDEYIRRFNERDATVFDDFWAPDLEVTNGGLTLYGLQSMKDHYEKMIWPTFIERLNVEEFVSSADTLAIKMWTNFEAKQDDQESIFGAVNKGEQFDYRGIIMYRIRDGLFTRIWVAYNSFMNTKIDGTTVNMGIPH